MFGVALPPAKAPAARAPLFSAASVPAAGVYGFAAESVVAQAYFGVKPLAVICAKPAPGSGTPLLSASAAAFHRYAPTVAWKLVPAETNLPPPVAVPPGLLVAPLLIAFTTSANGRVVIELEAPLMSTALANRRVSSRIFSTYLPTSVVDRLKFACPLANVRVRLLDAGFTAGATLGRLSAPMVGAAPPGSCASRVIQASSALAPV